MVMRRGVVDVVSTRMQDNPLGLKSGFPVLGCDLWEHAYYLENRNRKKKWIDTFWEIINWEEVENRIHMAESYDE
jgi:Fe-Mn family superoxide dismutase